MENRLKTPSSQCLQSTIKVLVGIMFVLFFVGLTSAITWDNTAYWNFDSGDGNVSNLWDVTGNGNNGTAVNSPTNITGKLGYAMNFSTATQSFFSVPDDSDLDFGENAWSISVWIKAYKLDGDLGVFSKGGYVWFRTENSTHMASYYANLTTSANAFNLNPTLANWTHYVLVYEGGASGNFIMYKDGVAENEAYTSKVNGDSISDLFIGSLFNPVYAWNGSIDEMGVWKRALSGAEVIELYNGGSGLSSPFGNISVASSISLISPANSSILSTTGENFTVSFNITGATTDHEWKNATYSLWKNGVSFNQTTVTLSGNNTQNTLFIDDFTIGNYIWNVLGYYGNASFDNYTISSNYTFEVGATLSNVTYTSGVYETSNQMFSGNLSLLTGTTLYNVKLVYNGIESDGSLTSLANSTYLAYASIDIPTVTTATNYSFYFKLIYSIGAGSFLYQNTDAYNQTVNPISLVSCTSTTNQTLNFTAKDEEDLTSITDWNFLGTFEYWIGLGTTRKNVSINNLNINYSSLCINPNNLTYKSDAIMQYEKNGFVKRNYYLYNATLNNVTNNITLYLLNTTMSTSFIVSVRDASQLPIRDAYIYIQRYYPGTGLYQTVAMSKTDASGNTVAHFEAETEDYRIIVMKNGVVIYTSPVQKIYCSATPCTLPIQTEGAGITTWTRIGNMSNMIYEGPICYKNTSMCYFTYIDTSGTTNYGRLLVYKINSGVKHTTICDVTSTSNAATLSCNITGYTGQIVAEGYISRSPEVLVWAYSLLVETIKDIMGMEGLFWAFLVVMLLGIGGIAVGGVVGGVLMTIISIVGMSLIGIASIGAIAMWGIIIIGLVVIWLIKN